MEEEVGCCASASDLLCAEDGACLDVAEAEDEGGVDGVVLVDDSALLQEEEYVGLLVSKESSFEGGGNSGGWFSSSGSGDASSAGDWLKSARSGAVRWILKTRAYFGFSLRTAYLAVTYLDRFFLRRTIDRKESWAMQLLSVACLSLAAKMEECRVPALSEFPVEEYQFDGKAIRRMELLVLSTLEWRMSSVTPFLYLNYFAAKLGGGLGDRGLFHRAAGFIFATIEVMNLMDYRPSAAAAAAVFAASGQALTRGLLEDKMGGILSTCGSLEMDHILSCYNVMIQESQKLQRSITRSSGDAIDDPPFSWKRRKVAPCSSYSCNSPISNKKQSD